ncbi:MAG: FG-GAP-like repeat-containing protein, partial [Candidatus Zixiibacteriota bacterium]
GDLVTANEYSDDVSLLFNNGDGTFGEAVSCSLGWRTYPMAVSSSDIDGDTDYDLAVACRHGDLFTLSNSGSGSFQVAARYDLSSRYSISLADLDDDGDDDLLGCSGEHAKIMLNNGDGTFQAARVLSMNDPQGLFAEDLDGDEDYDLAVVEGYLDSVSVLLNNGDGSFQPGVNYPVGESPGNVLSADVNGDLTKDLVVTNSEHSTISVLLNNGDGTFQSPMNFHTLSGLEKILLSDLDGDGDKDVVFMYKGSQGYAYLCRIAIMFNNGNGTFGSPLTFFSFEPWSLPGGVVAVDLDGDQDNDLAAVCRSSDLSLAILKNDGQGAFQAENVYEVLDPVTLAGADLDGDGDCDLAVAHSGHLLPYDILRVYLNNGDASFYQAGDHALPTAPSSMVADDLDRDGDKDLAVASQDNSVTVFLNDGSANLERQAPFDYGTGWFPLRLTGADFDGDGDFDLVTSNYYTDDITILFNLTNTYCIAGDANGDGLVDVGDVVYLTGFLYKGGSAPDPLWTGDCNCDDTVNLGDVVYLINYLFKAGPPPGC